MINKIYQPTKQFSGSYLLDDVIFLLKPIQMQPIDILTKEEYIQSGKYHYSEMLSVEHLPSKEYLNIFIDALHRNKYRFAQDLLCLAQQIAQQYPNELTLVSLARAGTPVGILLKKILGQLLGKTVKHYSISIIRDRGIDTNAITYLLQHEQCAQESIVFIDGWTGKGVIAAELVKSIIAYNEANLTAISSKLHVVADLCGFADITATNDDYLIPSSLLNATISGLISRSILNSNYLSQDDFHGCIYYDHLHEQDRSQWFIDIIFSSIQDIYNKKEFFPKQNLLPKGFLQLQNRDFVNKCMQQYEVKNSNYVKPGIGETTRVLLRRVPDLILLQNLENPDVQHLILLAQEKQVKIIVDQSLPYAAAALIQLLVL